MTATDRRGRPIRVLLGAGEPERERVLLLALATQGLEVVGRCLDADSLLSRATVERPDIALIASDLHRLRPETTTALAARSIPSVLMLTTGSDAERYPDAPYVIAGGDVADIVAAIDRAVTGGVAREEASSGEGRSSKQHSSAGELIVVTSGKGAPGATTVAISLAALSGRSARTALLDADLRGGDAGAYLGLDPRQGLATLLSADRSDLTGDLPLQETAEMHVLVGIERPELARHISGGGLLAVVRALGDRFERVVVDAGSTDSGSVTTELLRSADRVLLVTQANLVALWRAQLAVTWLREAGVEADRLALVTNRREGREHYDGDEVASALGVPVAGVVREDRASVRRAIDEHVPLSAIRGRAARDLREVGEHLFEMAATPRTRLGMLRARWPRGTRQSTGRMRLGQAGEEATT